MREKINKKLDDQFIERWSPRSFREEYLEESDIKTLFEAARWSPSCFNEQPWFFCYSANDDESKAGFVSALVEQNQMWAKRAPMLVFLFARRAFVRNGKANGWCEFDCGSAWLSLALQARKIGLYAHAMAGFNPEKALKVCGLNSAEYKPMAAIAVGKKGSRDKLPQAFQSMEEPNSRIKIDEFAKRIVKQK